MFKLIMSLIFTLAVFLQGSSLEAATNHLPSNSNSLGEPNIPPLNLSLLSPICPKPPSGAAAQLVGVICALPSSCGFDFDGGYCRHFLYCTHDFGGDFINVDWAADDHGEENYSLRQVSSELIAGRMGVNEVALNRCLQQLAETPCEGAGISVEGAMGQTRRDLSNLENLVEGACQQVFSTLE